MVLSPSEVSLSYIAPSIAAIYSPSPSISISPLELDNVPRAGGVSLTVLGQDFGAYPVPEVYIGSSLCGEVVYSPCDSLSDLDLIEIGGGNGTTLQDYCLEHTAALTCVIQPGFQLSLELIISQSDSQTISTQDSNSAKLSYAYCEPGYRSHETSPECFACELNQFSTDPPSMFCLECGPGYYTNGSGSSACKFIYAF